MNIALPEPQNERNIGHLNMEISWNSFVGYQPFLSVFPHCHIVLAFNIAIMQNCATKWSFAIYFVDELGKLKKKYLRTLLEYYFN